MAADQQALAVATQALHVANQVGVPWTKALIDNTPLGTFWVRVGVAVGTTDTNIAIKLPRIPTGYIVVRSSNGATIFDGTSPATQWTGANITLRASGATVVTLLIA
jgi:hypothetical protein